MVNATQLEWGFKTENLEAPALWGCRAIINGRGRRITLDLLWDRQGCVGEQAAREPLLAALNAGAMDALRAWVAKDMENLIDEDGTEILHLKGVVFHVRRAGGYLYVSAALDLHPPLGGRTRR